MLVRCALPAWGAASNSAVALMNVSENAKFRIDGARSMVVRAYRAGYHEETEIRSELTWIEALRGAGVISRSRCACILTRACGGKTCHPSRQGG